MEEIKKAILAVKVVVSGHFIFADGDHATTKLEIDNLWKHPKELGMVLDALARADGLPAADIIIGVPTGGQRLAQGLVSSGRLDVPIVLLERVPGGAKQDFRFLSEADENLARASASIRIYEDVVTTLSSVSGAVRLLDPARQRIHSLAIWRRGTVKDKYRQGVTDHYLVEKLMPVFSASDCPFPGCEH